MTRSWNSMVAPVSGKTETLGFHSRAQWFFFLTLFPCTLMLHFTVVELNALLADEDRVFLVRTWSGSKCYTCGRPKVCRWVKAACDWREDLIRERENCFLLDGTFYEVLGSTKYRKLQITAGCSRGIKVNRVWNKTWGDLLLTAKFSANLKQHYFLSW